MRLTGRELFDVERDGRRRRLPLSDLDSFEVLGLANGYLRAKNHDLANALYEWQWRLRRSGGKPHHSA